MSAQLIKLLPAVLLQCVLLSAAQLLLKVSVERFGDFSWTWSFFAKALTTLPFYLSGLCAVAGSVLWMVILKHYDFSLAYPLTSLSYVVGLVAAQWILHEPVSPTRWLGVAIIVLGVFFVVK